MMPEEKANELFESFNVILNDKDKAKECVMICIEKIERMGAYNPDYLFGIDYWNKVKKFVKKL